MENGFSDFVTELETGGKLIYTSVGVSMMPLIRGSRDVLVIEKCDIPSLKKYDVVLFRRNNVSGRGEYVLHRILKKLPDGRFFIAGDNCESGETVDAADILGVLTSIGRDGGKVTFDGAGYRLYVTFWCAPYRLRFFFLRAKRSLGYAARAAARRLGIKK